ncbi:MAG: DUF4013 domain-containing protein [Candidatus Kerfeldbacteria bacterium]|nr:DUF4013 domain-containing protein [Candidatus Kerfeldbacteria bacterium]
MTLSSEQFNEIIKYPFSGKDWFIRISLQGALLALLCPFLIGIPFLAGFVITHTRRGIDGSLDYPSWNDWGLYWSRGWRALAVNVVYYLPILALFVTYMVVAVIPLVVGAVTESDALMAVGSILAMLGSVVLYACMFVYAIFYSLVQMATAPLVALDLPIAASFQLKHYVWPYMKANIVNMILAFLITYLCALVANIGLLLLFIGIFFTFPIAVAMMAYANGLIYRISTVKYPASH